MVFKYFAIFFIFICCACNNRDPKPELRDPVYTALQSEKGAAEKNLQDAEKELIDAEKDVAKSDLKASLPRSVRITNLHTTKAKVERCRQEVEFAVARVNNRQREARLEYNHAMNKHQEWPKAANLSAFLKEREIRSRPKNYSEVHQQRLEATRKPASAPHGDEHGGGGGHGEEHH